MPTHIIRIIIAATFMGRAVAAEKFVFTGNKEYPPLVFLEDGQPKGIYPDLIRAMQAGGLDVEIKLMDWQAAQNAVLEGKADAIIGMAILEERKKKFDFTDSLLAHEFAIFVRRNDFSTQSFSGLKNKVVGVIPGSVPIVQLMGDSDIHFREIVSYKEGFTRLKTGKLDALILNEWVATYLLYHNGIDDIVPVKSASVIGGPAGFGVRKGNTAMVRKINAELRKLKLAGKTDEILGFWAPHSMIIWPQSKLRNLTLLFGASATGLILLLLILWIFTLLRNLKIARAAEEQLRESHELLGKLTDQAPGMIYQFKMSPDGKYSLTYTSKAIEILQEIPPEVAKSDFSFLEKRVHPDDKDRFHESIRFSAENLVPWRHEYRMVLPRQGVRWRLGESQPQRMPDGTVLWHGYLSDITEQKEREAQIAELSSKIIDLREKERAEISHELHDTVGQSLVILKLHLENKMKLLDDAQKIQFKELFETIDRVLASARDISRRLSPLHLHSLGIAGVIEDLCDQIRKSRNFRISVDIADFARCVSDDAAIQIYRIVQEALTNILKHSNADEIRIYSQSGEQCTKLIIADNGKNDLSRQSGLLGIGLQIMRERARVIEGTFRFEVLADGARVEIELPKRLALAQSQNTG